MKNIFSFICQLGAAYASPGADHEAELATMHHLHQMDFMVMASGSVVSGIQLDAYFQVLQYLALHGPDYGYQQLCHELGIENWRPSVSNGSDRHE